MADLCKIFYSYQQKTSQGSDGVAKVETLSGSTSLLLPRVPVRDDVLPLVQPDGAFGAGETWFYRVTNVLLFPIEQKKQTYGADLGARPATPVRYAAEVTVENAAMSERR